MKSAVSKHSPWEPYSPKIVVFVAEIGEVSHWIGFNVKLAAGASETLTFPCLPEPFSEKPQLILSLFLKSLNSLFWII